MKALNTLPILLLLILSSCYVDLELDRSYVHVGAIEEYETKEVINQVWSRGQLIYEEAVYTAWLDLEFINTGGMTARNVWAEITIYEGYRMLRSQSIDLPNIKGGHSVTISYDTGQDFTDDFTDYEVSVYWD
jgi:hypothetical protein